MTKEKSNTTDTKSTNKDVSKKPVSKTQKDNKACEQEMKKNKKGDKKFDYASFEIDPNDVGPHEPYNPDNSDGLVETTKEKNEAPEWQKGTLRGAIYTAIQPAPIPDDAKKTIATGLSEGVHGMGLGLGFNLSIGPLTAALSGELVYHNKGEDKMGEIKRIIKNMAVFLNASPPKLDATELEHKNLFEKNALF